MFVNFSLRFLAAGFILVASISVAAEMRFGVDLKQFAAGKVLFQRQWQIPSDANLPDEGLGPLYNANSCVACHVNNGRGRPLESGRDNPSFLLRLSIAPRNDADRLALALEQNSLIGEPHYGEQLQTRAIAGARAEGAVVVTWHDKVFALDDGEKVILRRPAYTIDQLAYGPLHKDTQFSPRLAQPLFGLGLLAKVPEEQILALEDGNDEDGDGISGRANRVRELITDKIKLGRFGWKASVPSLLQQTISAFAHDIGISSPFKPQTAPACDRDDAACRLIPRPGGHEVGMAELRQVVTYVGGLPAPERGLPDNDGAHPGKNLFNQIGCATCHRSSFDITVKNSARKDQPVTIRPYSDLLLHDMGAGLADHRPVARASGWEWRTQPLWGIGLEINGNSFFLHDGRARTIEEAVLWHGGEARDARAGYAALSKKERDELIGFLKGI